MPVLGKLVVAPVSSLSLDDVKPVVYVLHGAASYLAVFRNDSARHPSFVVRVF